MFWVIRLAVRYGMHDALTMHRDWLTSQRDHDAGAGWRSGADDARAEPPHEAGYSSGNRFWLRGSCS